MIVWLIDAQIEPSFQILHWLHIQVERLLVKKFVILVRYLVVCYHRVADLLDREVRQL